MGLNHHATDVNEEPVNAMQIVKRISDSRKKSKRTTGTGRNTTGKAVQTRTSGRSTKHGTSSTARAGGKRREGKGSLSVKR